MRINHKRRIPAGYLYLWLETGAFFLFSAALCTLTILGGLGVDPFAKDSPQVQQQSISRGN
jgi:hypothetical protein